jgi:hypothetical protein
MIAVLSAALLQMDPVVEVGRLSDVGMNTLNEFKMEMTSTLTGKNGLVAPPQKYRIFVQRPDRAQVQILDPTGALKKEVLITPTEETVADYLAFQNARKPRAAKVGLKDAAVLRLPVLDPFVLAMLEKEGWTEYVEESFNKVKGWRAQYLGGAWRLATEQKSGRIRLTFASPNMLPIGMEIGKGSEALRWKTEISPLPSNHRFKIRAGTRSVPSISVPPPPRPMDAETQRIVERVWAYYDRPRLMAIRIKETGSEPYTLFTDGFSVRQTQGNVSWVWSKGKAQVEANGRVFSGPAGREGLTNAAGNAGLRLDPTFGPMAFGDNPFRRFLSSAEVEIEGKIPTDEGQVVLLKASTREVIVTMGVKESDGRVLSVASLPLTGGATLSNQRSFEYLDPSLAGPSAFKLKGGKALSLAQIPQATAQ